MTFRQDFYVKIIEYIIIVRRNKFMKKTILPQTILYPTMVAIGVRPGRYFYKLRGGIKFAILIVNRRFSKLSEIEEVYINCEWREKCFFFLSRRD